MVTASSRTARAQTNKAVLHARSEGVSKFAMRIPIEKMRTAMAAYEPLLPVRNAALARTRQNTPSPHASSGRGPGNENRDRAAGPINEGVSGPTSAARTASSKCNRSEAARHTVESAGTPVDERAMPQLQHQQIPELVVP